MHRITVVVFVALVALPAFGQQRWDWPERAENLTVLPAEFPPQRLRAVMTGFTRALGVRCSHCHVGTEGEPLSSYDFASDANPKKHVARTMLEMLGDINDRLETIARPESGPPAVNMWCHTCHAGRARPARLAEELAATEATSGFDVALARYDELRGRYHGRGAYDFGEGSLNAWGYELLEAGKHDAAIAVFTRNAREFPESGNVWDSLAEAYASAGKREQAIVFYGRALEADPSNTSAAERLAALRAGE